MCYARWLVVFLVMANLVQAQEPVPSWQQLLDAQEFPQAVQQAQRLPAAQKDAALAQIAIRQRQTGDYAGAAATSRAMDDPSQRGNSLVGGAGGAADFDSLMNLIRTTVEPDTWVDNGGTSNMQPYFGGISIDAKGLVADLPSTSSLVNRPAASELLARGAAPPSASLPLKNGGRDDESWQVASAGRSISLRALQMRLAARLATGMGPDEAMRNLAGITNIFAVAIPEDRSDIILMGRVGTLQQQPFYGLCDQASGRPTVRLEDLTAVLAAVTQAVGISCSIDPTQQGLAQVQSVANEVRSGKLKGDAASKALAAALGGQAVTLGGLHADDPASLALVIADRHLKMLALGKAACPVGVNNYFQWTEQLMEQRGLPDGQLLRLWFTGKPIEVFASHTGNAWMWDGVPIELLSEKEMADALGRRQVAGEDPRAVGFAKQMTEHFEALPKVEPIYGRLAGIFELALALGLAHQHTPSPAQWHQAVGLLATPDTWQQRLPNPPRLVESLVADHTFRRGRQRHVVTVISGGIELNPRTLASRSKPQASSEADKLIENNLTEATIARWWWDHPK